MSRELRRLFAYIGIWLTLVAACFGLGLMFAVIGVIP